jgi:hypothetical protein
MTEILQLLSGLVLSIGLPAALIRRDMRGLPPIQARRAWNSASFWSAVVGFGPLALVVHFTRTRRTVVGALWGLSWAVGIFAICASISTLLASFD